MAKKYLHHLTLIYFCNGNLDAVILYFGIESLSSICSNIIILHLNESVILLYNHWIVL
jgi:hypothetical protein